MYIGTLNGKKHTFWEQNMNNSWFTGTVNYKIIINRDLKSKRLRNTGLLYISSCDRVP
jgi:hypothetical protein